MMEYAVLVIACIVCFVLGSITETFRNERANEFGNVIPPRISKGFERPPVDARPPLTKGDLVEIKPRVTPSTPVKERKHKTGKEIPIYYKKGLNKVLIGIAYDKIENAFDIVEHIKENGVEQELYATYEGIEYQFHNEK